MLALQVKYPDNYVYMDLDDDIDEVICYKSDTTKDDWKITFPEAMIVDTVKWFHQVMRHPGDRRLHYTLSQFYHNLKQCYHVNRLKCKDCWNHKLAGCGYGYAPLPKREVHIAPWEEEAMDLIGPRKVKINDSSLSSMH